VKKVEPLIRLQQVDSALDRARERLRQVEEQLADRSALVSVEAAQSSAEAEHRRLTTEQRDLELEVDNLRQKLQQIEQRLYSGRVSNPKELSDLHAEGQQERRLIGTREDRLIGLFDEVDAAKQGLDEANAALQQTTAEHEASQAELRRERDQLRSELEALERERPSIVERTDPRGLRSYESLRRTRGGLAVAQVAQRTCQGCRVSLPSSTAQEARTSDELVFCQSCGRILYSTF
jgi:predicted  nucleic acid-binding Zn-ribbon protein